MTTGLKCKITHPQIFEGSCPWCGHCFPEGSLATNPQERRWNAAAMADAIEDQDREVRSMTVSNVMLHGPRAELAVPLLSVACNDESASIREMAEHALHRLGRKLTVEETQHFEREVSRSPHEFAVRVLLLGYYFPGQRESAAARRARDQHVFWIINNAPESKMAGSPEGEIQDINDKVYTKAKQLWLDQVLRNPDNSTILGNAASFFLLWDTELSEDLLRRAQSLEPTNPHWRNRLGHLFSLQQNRGDQTNRLTTAKRAFEEYQAAEKLTTPSKNPFLRHGDGETTDTEDLVGTLLCRIHSLPDLAKSAFEAEQFDEAHAYATELLQKASSVELPEFFRNDGSALFDGNLVLGRVALQRDDLVEAKQHLIAAGKTTGSPALGSFGPNMTLAKELLEQGEREVVLQFFELCKCFWKHGTDALDEWAGEVRNGQIPDFGANLHY